MFFRTLARIPTEVFRGILVVVGFSLEVFLFYKLVNRFGGLTCCPRFIKLMIVSVIIAETKTLNYF